MANIMKQGAVLALLPGFFLAPWTANAAAGEAQGGRVRPVLDTAYRGFLRESAIPQPAREAARAVVKINVIKVTDKGLAADTGTGFAVQSPRGETFIATAAHVIYHLLQTGADAQIETLSETLLNAEIAAVDIKNDLALLKAPEYKGPHLPISGLIQNEPVFFLGFPSETREAATIKGFKSGKLQYSKALGAVYYSGSQFYAYTSLAAASGASGGPLLNRKGAAVGTVKSAGEYLLLGPVSSLLEDLLKTADEAGTEKRIVKNSIKKQMNSLTSALQRGDGRMAVKFLPFLADLLKAPDDVIKRVQNLALKDEDRMTLCDAGWHFEEKKDYDAAAEKFRLAADQGYGPAMVDLGRILLVAGGLAQTAEGLEYMRRAAGAVFSLIRGCPGRILPQRCHERRLTLKASCEKSA